MNMFHAPAVRHEFGRKPIEQFRMAWPLPLRAKIFRSGHQPAPEVLLPDAIDDHPRNGWMLRIDQPFGKRQPIASPFFGERVKYRRDARNNCFARFAEIATLEN